MQRFPALIVLILLFAVVPIDAQDGLYAPSRPEDAALVRVVNLSSYETSRVIDAGPVRFGPMDPMTVGPYRPVMADVYLLGDPENTLFTPEPRTFVTIVTGYDGMDSSRLVLFTDEPHDDPARAQLVMYNLSGRSLTLGVADSGPVVFEDLRPKEARVAAVNAITVDLVVQDHGTEADAITVELSRGSSFSIFALDHPDGTLLVIGSVASVETE